MLVLDPAPNIGSTGAAPVGFLGFPQSYVRGPVIPNVRPPFSTPIAQSVRLVEE
jgi:hypothetical protein